LLMSASEMAHLEEWLPPPGNRWTQKPAYRPADP